MRFPTRPALFLCFFLLLPAQVHADHGGLQRLALLVGANNGGPARTRLLHAHSDASAFGKVLRDLGGVEEDRQVLLTQPSVGTVRHHFAELGRRLGAINATGARAEFLFYYSGHSDERSLLLGDERLDYSTLRELLERQPAKVRIAILDSCASGALTRLKGGQWQLPFMVDASTSVQGHAFLTSASAEESAQESDRLGGSIFTHYLLSGLRGAADTSKDSRITLGEAYTYAFNETLTRTQVTQAGPQHPHYEMQLSGSGDVVLTDLRGISAALVLPEALSGRLYIKDANGALVAEINKPTGRAMKIGLGPGRYHLTLERPAELRTGWLTIAEEGETVLDPDLLVWEEKEQTRGRGGETPADTSDDRAAISEPPAQERLVRPFSFAFVPSMSTNDRHRAPGRLIVNNAAFNMLLDEGDILEGLELSGIGAIRSTSVTGVQAAGVFNLVHGPVQGLQFASAFNLAKGDLTGGQLASGANVVLGSFTGAMASSGLNVATGNGRGAMLGTFGNFLAGDLDGAQLAVVGNYAATVDGVQAAVLGNYTENLTGAQLAVLGNYSATLRGAQVSACANITGPLEGLQLAPTLNVARGVSGVQIGIINLSTEKVRGAQIGLINLAPETDFSFGLINLLWKGRWNLDAYLDEAGFTQVALKHGGRYFHYLLSLGRRSWGLEDRYSVGYGLGGHLPVNETFFVDLNLHDQHFFAKADRDDALLHLQGNLGWRLTPYVAVLFGPSVGLSYTAEPHPEFAAWSSRLAGGDPGDTTVRLWPGFTLGVQVF
ncbi:MAG: hypothetical protein A2284_01650 [Deltaproteobacteria bacterium RIFOXYA12_FULL_61_11]|nr:MAG: hypothetical protein A2284_01650 [Deltaproteobacteria bacterium RIFOXYA12_FULL_61_11]